jgi:hypothetical protein
VAYQDEVYYCGKCRRQQRPEQGEKCIHCGKQTVTWDTSRDSEATAQQNWKTVNGEW